MYDHVFVLWLDQFDEAVATIFVTELRQAGLRVKMVGLTSHQVKGVSGLALVPDLTLDQALPLALYVICLIIPCSAHSNKRLSNDPRLRGFFDRTLSKQVQLVVGPCLDEGSLAELGLGVVSADKVLTYPGHEDLVTFARRVADALLGIGPPLP